MHFIYNFIFLLGAIKWGDWRNWREYYPTILFFIGVDLLKNSLLHDYRFWEYQETLLGEELLFGHLVINLMIMAIVYPSTVLIYLGHFPSGYSNSVLWFLLWVFLYSSIEFINVVYLDLLKHYHGWNMVWSIIFNAVMFTILRIHHKVPLLAWALSILWIIFLWNIFNVPKEILN
jgi:hypothetical protein